MDGKTGWGWMEETVPTVSVDTAGLSVLPSSSSSFFFWQNTHLSIRNAISERPEAKELGILSSSKQAGK
jgi:hypothetical protein